MMSINTFRRLAIVAIFVAILFARARPADAVIIFLKDRNAAPIAAHVVSEDSSSITIRQPLPGGKYRERVLSKTLIDDILRTVSPKRTTRAAMAVISLREWR